MSRSSSTSAKRSRSVAQAPLLWSATCSLLLVTTAAAATGENAGQAERPALVEHHSLTVRGITLSTHRSGSEWGDPAVLDPTLDDLVAAGANWLSIHPYARIAADGTVSYRPFDHQHPPEWLRRPILEAHRRGLQILIKPHLGYWGTPFSWRGEIAFEDEASWRRFFTTYEQWIVDVARATVGADGFAVGTELDRTLDREEYWRRIIAHVHQVNGAALTYAANWTDYQRVPFWNQLDAIGIQAYFPLSDHQDPDEATLRRAWRDLMARLADYSKQRGLPIVFTELGYSRTWLAAKEPWLARTDDPEAEPLQARCLAIALEAIESEPAVVGAFLWKWFPQPRPVGKDFQLATPAIRAVLRTVWQPPSNTAEQAQR